VTFAAATQGNPSLAADSAKRHPEPAEREKSRAARRYIGMNISNFTKT
jgi:hypothetical protein